MPHVEYNPSYNCCCCNKHFTDWNELETHPCPIAEELAATEPLRTYTFSELGWDDEPLEDDYSEESYP